MNNHVPDVFLGLVEKMRLAQKRWSKYRRQEDLTAAVQMERLVDRAIEAERATRAASCLWDLVEEEGQ